MYSLAATLWNSDATSPAMHSARVAATELRSTQSRPPGVWHPKTAFVSVKSTDVHAHSGRSSQPTQSHEPGVAQ